MIWLACVGACLGNSIEVIEKFGLHDCRATDQLVWYDFRLPVIDAHSDWVTESLDCKSTDSGHRMSRPAELALNCFEPHTYPSGVGLSFSSLLHPQLR